MDYTKLLTDYEERIKKLSNSIKNFKNNIYKVYFSLGEILEKQVNITLETSDKGFIEILELVDSSHRTEFDPITDTEGILQLLQSNEKKLNEITNPIRERKDSNSESFSASLRYLSEINNMLKSVDVVQEFASEVEILSFNSIILASKSGGKGVGFKSISGYINRLSRDTKAKFEDLKGISEIVLQRYDAYNFLIINSRNIRVEKSNIIKKKSNEFFSKSIEKTTQVSESLVKIVKKIKDTKDGMFKLILELQNEDIVNQILSNLIHQIEIVITTLSKLDKNTKDKKEIKETMLFIIEIEKFLSEKLVKVQSILQKLLLLLEESLNNFYSTTDSCIDSLENVATVFDFKKSGNDYKDDFSNNFLYHSTELIKEYQYLLKQIISFQGEIDTTGKNFIINLNDVDKIYAKLDTIIKKMKSVNVLIKIELVREDLELDVENNTGDVMEKMLIKIGDYLTNLTEKFRSTKDKLSELMINIESSVYAQKDKYIKINKILSDFISDFLEKSKTFQENIYNSIESLDKTLKNTSKLINEIKNELAQIKTLVKEENIEINDLGENIEYITKNLFDEYNIEPNIEEIKNEKLYETLFEIEKRQNKASLNRYLEDDFNFEANDSNIIIF